MTAAELFVAVRPLAGTAGTPAEIDARVQAYVARVQETFALLRPWLPETVHDIVDLGCGQGGIGLLLANHYPQASLHLLDGGPAACAGHRPPHYKSFSPANKPWNNVRTVAAHFRDALGLKACGWEADPTSTIPCDILVSTRSWGHHYPIDVYLPFALRSVRPGGIVAVDIRAHTDGLSELQEYYQLRSQGSTSKKNKCTFAVFQRAH